MNFIRSHKTELILFILSFVIHLTLFSAMIEELGSVLDTVRVDDGYFELTQNVLAGNGFSWSAEAPYAPNPLRTPGYIYVLALLISVVGITGAALIQLVASSLIPVFGFYIAQRITGSKKAAIFTGVILAVDPMLAFLSFQFYTDTLFLLLFLPWLLLTFRYAKNPNIKTLIICAILLGIAILVRPVVQYVPILIALCIMWQFGKHNWHKSAIHIGVYFIIIGAILTPWIMRNVATFDSPGLSAQSSFVLYTNLAPAVLSVANGTNFQEERDSFLTFEEYKGDTITLKNASTYTEKAIDIVLEHPAATAYVMSKSVFTFFTNDGFYTLLGRLGHEPRDSLAFLVVMRLVWIFITLAAFVGALRYIFIQRSPWAIFTVTLVAYFAATSTIAAFGTNPRYRLPVDPIILALAAIGAVYIRTWVERYNIVPKIKKMIRRDNI
ncbi:MAG: 4-amino-4-deoxy-L-arabinose transferase-like glycosyltransferase [Candidatus Azotimanducaceae bacterium]|jgi:4-amino-4-deoxy-L-arabinose transferase-like glycosyltransferase